MCYEDGIAPFEMEMQARIGELEFIIEWYEEHGREGLKFNHITELPFYIQEHVTDFIFDRVRHYAKARDFPNQDELHKIMIGDMKRSEAKHIDSEFEFEKLPEYMEKVVANAKKELSSW